MPDTPSSSAVLVADIGGTNARFALADIARKQPLLEDSVRRYAVADHATLEDAIRQYLQDLGAHPRQAVLAVAGHIDNNEVYATNSPWHIAAAQVRADLQLDDVRLINDFAAQSLCLPLLTATDMTTIGAVAAPVLGAQSRQSFAVIGPGTGLGVGALVQHDGRYHALPSEGGHSGFAPGNEEEIEVLRYLARRFGRVSNERLISGEGLSNLHQALSALAGQPTEALPPEAITAAASAGGDALCVAAVERFCAIFGAMTGDAVLHFGSWPGAYLAGGLAPKLLPWLQQGGFRARFEAKGRLRAAISKTPTVVITHPQAGLLGAAASVLFTAPAHG